MSDIVVDYDSEHVTIYVPAGDTVIANGLPQHYAGPGTFDIKLTLTVSSYERALKEQADADLLAELRRRLKVTPS